MNFRDGLINITQIRQQINKQSLRNLKISIIKKLNEYIKTCSSLRYQRGKYYNIVKLITTILLNLTSSMQANYLFNISIIKLFSYLEIYYISTIVKSIRRSQRSLLREHRLITIKIRYHKLSSLQSLTYRLKATHFENIAILSLSLL